MRLFNYYFFFKIVIFLFSIVIGILSNTHNTNTLSLAFTFYYLLAFLTFLSLLYDITNNVTLYFRISKKGVVLLKLSPIGVQRYLFHYRNISNCSIGNNLSLVFNNSSSELVSIDFRNLKNLKSLLSFEYMKFPRLSCMMAQLLIINHGVLFDKH